MTTQVYQATNTVNGKVYFGKAANARTRWSHHVWAARTGCPYPFHRALRKYGATSFTLTVLATYETNEEACTHEITLIAQTDSKLRYNVAPGGEGGLTLTQTQIEAQYAIGPASYAEFRRLFAEGVAIPKIANHFGVAYNAVARCARRLGLSFAERRSPKAKIPPNQPKRVPKPPRTPKAKAQIEPKVPKPPAPPRSRARYAPEERTARRSAVNRARGLGEATQKDVLRLYCEDHLTAQQIAVQLLISRGSVRATINRAYARMSPADRAAAKRAHGSAVRSGSRNPNASR